MRGEPELVLVQPMSGSMEGCRVKGTAAKDVWKPKPLGGEGTGRCLSCEWHPVRREDWRRRCLLSGRPRRGTCSIAEDLRHTLELGVHWWLGDFRLGYGAQGKEVRVSSGTRVRQRTQDRNLGRG